MGKGLYVTDRAVPSKSVNSDTSFTKVNPHLGAHIVGNTKVPIGVDLEVRMSAIMGSRCAGPIRSHLI